MTKHSPLPSMQLSYGQVTDVDHPDGLYAVKVKLHQMFDAEGQEFEAWARVTAPFAGDGFGAVMLPDIGQEVIIGFVSGDTRFPIVLGALYTSEVRPFDEPVDGGSVKRWSMTGTKGTNVILDESSNSSIKLETAGGVKIEVTDDGRKVTATNGGSKITISPSGVKISTGSKVSVQASTVEVSAGMVQVDAGLSKFSGVIQCDALITNSVVSSSYTPGAGNVW